MCAPSTRSSLSSWSSASCTSSSLKWLILIIALAVLGSNVYANQATTTRSSTVNSSSNENDNFLLSPPLATHPSDENAQMRLRFRRSLISHFSNFKNRFSISHYHHQHQQQQQQQQQRARKPNSSFFASRTLLPANYNRLSRFVKSKLGNIVETINDYNARHYNNQSRSIKNLSTETTQTETGTTLSSPANNTQQQQQEQIETNGTFNDNNITLSSANNNVNDKNNNPEKELNKNRRNDIDMLMTNEFLLDNNPRANTNNADNSFSNSSQHVSPTLNIIDVEPDNTKIAHNILLVHRKNAPGVTRVPPPPVVISSDVNVNYFGQSNRDQSKAHHYGPTSLSSSTTDKNMLDESNLEFIPMKSNHKPSTFISFSEWKLRNKLKTSTTSTIAPISTISETTTSTAKEMNQATSSSYLSNLIIKNDHPTTLATTTPTTTMKTTTPSLLAISDSKPIETVYHHQAAAASNHDQHSLQRPTTSFSSSNSIHSKHNLQHSTLAAQINIIDSQSVNTNNVPKSSTRSPVITTGAWHTSHTTTSPTTITSANKLSSLITMSHRPSIIKLPYPTTTASSGQSLVSSYTYTTRSPLPSSVAAINSNDYWNSFTTEYSPTTTTEGVTEFDLPGTESSNNEYFSQNELANTVNANQTKVFESTTTVVTDNPIMTTSSATLSSLDKSDNLENKDTDTTNRELTAQGYSTLSPYYNHTTQLNLANMSHAEHMYHGNSHKSPPSSFLSDDGIFVFKNNHGKPTRPISMVNHHHHHQHHHQHDHQQLTQHNHNHQPHVHRHTARPPYVTDFNYPTTTTTTKKPFISISNINSHRVKQPDEIKSSSLTILDPIFIQGLMELPLNTTIVHKNILVPMKKGRPKPNYPIRPTTQFPILPVVAGVTNWQSETTEWFPPAITTSSPDKIDLIPVANSKPSEEFDMFPSTVIPQKTVHKVITIFPSTTAQTVTATFSTPSTMSTTTTTTTERPSVVTQRPFTASTAYVNAIYAPPMPLLHNRPSHSLEAPSSGSWLTAITKILSKFTGEGGINFMSVFRTVIYSLMLMVLPPLAMATSMSLL